MGNLKETVQKVLTTGRRSSKDSSKTHRPRISDPLHMGDSVFGRTGDPDKQAAGAFPASPSQLQQGQFSPAQTTVMSSQPPAQQGPATEWESQQGPAGLGIYYLDARSVPHDATYRQPDAATAGPSTAVTGHPTSTDPSRSPVYNSQITQTPVGQPTANVNDFSCLAPESGYDHNYSSLNPAYPPPTIQRNQTASYANAKIWTITESEEGDNPQDLSASHDTTAVYAEQEQQPPLPGHYQTSAPYRVNPAPQAGFF